MVKEESFAESRVISFGNFVYRGFILKSVCKVALETNGGGAGICNQAENFRLEYSDFV